MLRRERSSSAEAITGMYPSKPTLLFLLWPCNLLSERTRPCSRLSLAIAGVLLLIVSSPAYGAPPPDAPPAAAAASSAGEEASNHFKRGLQLFDDSDYTLALVEFERAYQLAPNYRALYNIALVDMQLGRYADAARTLEQYIHDGGSAIAPARRAEVDKTLGELKFRTAVIEVSLNVPHAEVMLDGKPLDPARLAGPTVIDAGEHTLRATAPGYAASDRTVTLAGGDRAAVRLELVPFALPHAPVFETAQRPRSIFWPGFVATGVLAAGAIVSGLVTLSLDGQLNTLKDTPGSSQAKRTSAANNENAAALTADILTGLAVVAGGMSIYFTLGPDHGSKAPSLAVSPQRVVLSGSF